MFLGWIFLLNAQYSYHLFKEFSEHFIRQLFAVNEVNQFRWHLPNHCHLRNWRAGGLEILPCHKNKMCFNVISIGFGVNMLIFRLSLQKMLTNTFHRNLFRKCRCSSHNRSLSFVAKNETLKWRRGKTWKRVRGGRESERERERDKE